MTLSLAVTLLVLILLVLILLLFRAICLVGEMAHINHKRINAIIKKIGITEEEIDNIIEEE